MEGGGGEGTMIKKKQDSRAKGERDMIMKENNGFCICVYVHTYTYTCMYIVYHFIEIY